MAFFRLRLWLPALVFAVAGAAAQAQTMEDAIVAQLRAQGFVEVQVSRTLLGRLHIIAVGPDYRREIVINPVSGEILRDYMSALSNDTPGPIIVIPDRRSPERDDDDDGDDDGDDDDGDDDDDDRDDDDGDDDDDD